MEKERDRKTRNQRDRENGHSVPKLRNVGLGEEAVHTPRCSPDQDSVLLSGPAPHVLPGREGRPSAT